MTNAFGAVKDSVNSFTYIYGCSVQELPVTVADRIEMHKAQAKAASELYSRLYDASAAKRNELTKILINYSEDKVERHTQVYEELVTIQARMRVVKEAQEWNEAMLKELNNETLDN